VQGLYAPGLFAHDAHQRVPAAEEVVDPLADRNQALLERMFRSQN
jgi:hypothetical protein